MRSGRLVTLAAGLVVLAMLVMVVAQAAPAKPVQRPRGPAAGGGPGMRGGGRGMNWNDPKAALDGYAKMLGLSAAQKARAKPIFDNQIRQAKAIQGNKKLSDQQKMQKFMAVSRDAQAKLRKILTPQQLRKQDDMDMGLERMAQFLGLSPAQRTKIRPILAKQQSQMRAVFGDQKLSQAKRMAKMQALGAASQAQIKKFLTPAQRKKWDAMGDRMRGMGRGQGGGRGGPGGGGRGPGGPR